MRRATRISHPSRLKSIAQWTLIILFLLLPPLLTSALWISSYFREDDFNFTREIPLHDGTAKELDVPAVAEVHDFTLASHSGMILFKYLRGAVLTSSDAPITNEWHWFDGNIPDAPLLDPKAYFDEEPKRQFWHTMGFFYDDGCGSGLKYNGGIWRHRAWFCPWWCVTLLSSLPLSVYAANRWLTLRRVRLAKGCCPTCSYDLRAHKPGDKCPECGTPVVASPVKPTS